MISIFFVFSSINSITSLAVKLYSNLIPTIHSYYLFSSMYLLGNRHMKKLETEEEYVIFIAVSSAHGVEVNISVQVVAIITMSLQVDIA